MADTNHTFLEEPKTEQRDDVMDAEDAHDDQLITDKGSDDVQKDNGSTIAPNLVKDPKTEIIQDDIDRKCENAIPEPLKRPLPESIPSTSEGPNRNVRNEPNAKMAKLDEEEVIEEDNNEEKHKNEEKDENEVTEDLEEQDEADNEKDDIVKKTGKKPAKGRKSKKTVSSNLQAIHKACDRWNAMALISQARFDSEENISLKAKSVLETFDKAIQEHNTYTVDLPFGMIPNNSENYRGLDEPIRKLLLSAMDPAHAIIDRRKKYCLPFFNFTGPSFMDTSKVTAQEVVETAKEWRLKKVNKVFAPHDKKDVEFIFNKISTDAVEREKQFFLEKCPEEDRKRIQNGINNGYLPVASYTVPDGSDETLKKLDRILEKSSFCHFKNFAEALNIDLSQFSGEQLAEAGVQKTIHLRRQMAQASTLNWNYRRGNHKSNGWWYENLCDHDVQLNDFMEHKKKIQELSKAARQQIAEDPDNMEKHLKKFIATLRSSVLPWENNTTKGAMKGKVAQTFLLPFCTNLNVTEKFEKATTEVKRFPIGLAPNTGLLRFGDDIIPGINEAQAYLKFPGARTPAHTENLCIGSFNMNIGPGTNVWYSVPFEFKGKLEALLGSHGCSMKRIDKDYGFWPNVEHLRKAGIPVQKVETKPGEAVFVGFGTYHWVQSNGFADNIAWNIVLPTFDQLAIAAIDHDHRLVIENPSVVSLEHMIWGMAMKKAPMEGELKKLVKTMLMRSLAKAQFEDDFISHKKWKVKPATEASLDPVERCPKEKCKQTLHNFVPIVNEKVLCLKCCQNIPKGSKDVVVYRRHKIDDLKKAFDSIKMK